MAVLVSCLLSPPLNLRYNGRDPPTANPPWIWLSALVNPSQIPRGKGRFSFANRSLLRPFGRWRFALFRSIIELRLSDGPPSVSRLLWPQGSASLLRPRHRCFLVVKQPRRCRGTATRTRIIEYHKFGRLHPQGVARA